LAGSRDLLWHFLCPESLTPCSPTCTLASRIYIVVAITILLVAIAATYIPARRAAHVDLMQALRQE